MPKPSATLVVKSASAAATFVAKSIPGSVPMSNATFNPSSSAIRFQAS